MNDIIQVLDQVIQNYELLQWRKGSTGYNLHGDPIVVSWPNRHRFIDDKGKLYDLASCCIIGSLRLAAVQIIMAQNRSAIYYNHIYMQVRDAVVEQLQEMTGSSDIVDWNDNLSPGNGKAKVLELLRATREQPREDRS